MAIVKRKLKKGGHSYWVVVTWQGKAIWRRIGRDKSVARAKEKLWQAQIKDGTFSPEEALPVSPRVREYIPVWLKRRTNRTAEKDDSMMRLHVLPHALADLYVSEVRQRHTRELVDELRAKGLSDKSISNVLGALRAMFSDAKDREYTHEQPISLPKRTLHRRRQKDPEIYQPAECRVLMTNQNLDVRIRMLWTILLCTGMREGEAVGRRWGDFAPAEGLHALHVKDQYGGEPLKTDNPRVVPVHPVLSRALIEWRQIWPMLQGRQPREQDFIVPGFAKPMMTRSSAYKWLRASCEQVGVRWKSLHSTRHTFITLARRGDADKQALEQVTHNSKGDIVDGYTQSDWKPLCDAVRAVSFDSDQKIGLPSAEKRENPFLGSGGNVHVEAATVPNNILMAQGSPGFDSPRLHKTAAKKGYPQDSSQKPSQSPGGRFSSMGRREREAKALKLGLAAVASRLLFKPGETPPHPVSEAEVERRALAMTGGVR